MSLATQSLAAGKQSVESELQQQSRCYLCETPKAEYSLVRSFSEPICRGCVNFEGPDRVEQLISSARKFKSGRELGPEVPAIERPQTDDSQLIDGIIEGLSDVQATDALEEKQPHPLPLKSSGAKHYAAEQSATIDLSANSAAASTDLVAASSNAGASDESPPVRQANTTAATLPVPTRCSAAATATLRPSAIDATSINRIAPEQPPQLTTANYSLPAGGLNTQAAGNFHPAAGTPTLAAPVAASNTHSWTHGADDSTEVIAGSRQRTSATNLQTSGACVTGQSAAPLWSSTATTAATAPATSNAPNANSQRAHPVSHQAATSSASPTATIRSGGSLSFKSLPQPTSGGRQFPQLNPYSLAAYPFILRSMHPQLNGSGGHPAYELSAAAAAMAPSGDPSYPMTTSGAHSMAVPFGKRPPERQQPPQQQDGRSLGCYPASQRLPPPPHVIGPAPTTSEHSNCQFAPQSTGAQQPPRSHQHPQHHQHHLNHIQQLQVPPPVPPRPQGHPGVGVPGSLQPQHPQQPQLHPSVYPPHYWQPMDRYIPMFAPAPMPPQAPPNGAGSSPPGLPSGQHPHHQQDPVGSPNSRLQRAQSPASAMAAIAQVYCSVQFDPYHMHRAVATCQQQQVEGEAARNQIHHQHQPHLQHKHRAPGEPLGAGGPCGARYKFDGSVHPELDAAHNPERMVMRRLLTSDDVNNYANSTTNQNDRNKPPSLELHKPTSPRPLFVSLSTAPVPDASQLKAPAPRRDSSDQSTIACEKRAQAGKSPATGAPPPPAASILAECLHDKRFEPADPPPPETRECGVSQPTGPKRQQAQPAPPAPARRPYRTKGSSPLPPAGAASGGQAGKRPEAAACGNGPEPPAKRERLVSKLSGGRMSYNKKIVALQANAVGAKKSANGDRLQADQPNLNQNDAPNSRVHSNGLRLEPVSPASPYGSGDDSSHSERRVSAEKSPSEQQVTPEPLESYQQQQVAQTQQQEPKQAQPQQQPPPQPQTNKNPRILIKCVHCSRKIDDRHFVQCPSVDAHKYCFTCSKSSIVKQRENNLRQKLEMERVFCPSGNRCDLPNESSPWTFMNNEIETIFRDALKEKAEDEALAMALRLEGANDTVHSSNLRDDESNDNLMNDVDSSSSSLQIDVSTERSTPSDNHRTSGMQSPAEMPNSASPIGALQMMGAMKSTPSSASAAKQQNGGDGQVVAGKGDSMLSHAQRAPSEPKHKFINASGGHQHPSGHHGHRHHSHHHRGQTNIKS